VTDSRFSSIGQILDRRIPPAALPEDDSSSTAVEPAAREGTITRIEDAPQTGRARERQADREPDPKAAHDAVPGTSSRSSGGVRRIVFRLDPDLHKSLEERATAQRTSYGQLVLDAVEAVHSGGQLSALLAASGSARDDTGLFPRLRARADARPAVSVEIRVDARAVEILDRLVQEQGAENRTHLMVTALTAHLG
jgi:hypothetical protein